MNNKQIAKRGKKLKREKEKREQLYKRIEEIERRKYINKLQQNKKEYKVKSLISEINKLNIEDNSEELKQLLNEYVSYYEVDFNINIRG